MRIVDVLASYKRIVCTAILHERPSDSAMGGAESTRQLRPKTRTLSHDDAANMFDDGANVTRETPSSGASATLVCSVISYFLAQCRHEATIEGIQVTRQEKQQVGS